MNNISFLFIKTFNIPRDNIKIIECLYYELSTCIEKLNKKIKYGHSLYPERKIEYICIPQD